MELLCWLSAEASLASAYVYLAKATPLIFLWWADLNTINIILRIIFRLGPEVLNLDPI